MTGEKERRPREPVRRVRVAMPNKGRMRESAIRLFTLAGVGPRFVSERSLAAPMTEGYQAIFVRAADIPEYVADGAADAGVTGHDLVRESGRDLEELLDLDFASCRLVVAVREESRARSATDLPTGSRIATSFPNLARRHFDSLGLSVVIAPVTGAAEIAPHLGVADAIVDLASTGSTMRVHGLREIDEVLTSTARLVVRPQWSASSGPALAELAAAVESVVRARSMRYLMANVPRARLGEVKTVLPGLTGPTMTSILNSEDWLAVHAVVRADSVLGVVAKLRRLGAQGVVVTAIERLVP